MPSTNETILTVTVQATNARQSWARVEAFGADGPAADAAAEDPAEAVAKAVAPVLSTIRAQRIALLHPEQAQ